MPVQRQVATSSCVQRGANAPNIEDDSIMTSPERVIDHYRAESSLTLIDESLRKGGPRRWDHRLGGPQAA